VIRLIPHLAAVLSLFVVAAGTHASVPEESWTISVSPSFSPGIAPSWASGSKGHPSMDTGDSLLIPLPSTASMDDDACLVVTVVFDDTGDGGPVAEWLPPGGDAILLSAGLGETGVAPGPNARTLLLPQSITLDGGTLKISHTGRIQRLLSVTVRLAAACPVASLAPSVPALVDSSLQVMERQEISGESFEPRTGDRSKGFAVDAELAPAPLRLDSPDPEFVIPVSRAPAGAVLSGQLAGLDPESRIEVSVNGQRAGELAPSAVALDDPSAIISPEGRLTLAGWRRASLMLPASLWHSGENTVSLRLRRGPGDPGRRLYGRDIRISVLFPPAKTKTASSRQADANPADRLSNGSEFVAPRPDAFRAGIPAVTGP
jgi:hypothetical protein